MNITLRVWRQQNAQAEGRMVTYQVQDVSEDMSFLEMLDLLRQRVWLHLQHDPYPAVLRRDLRVNPRGLGR